MKEIADKTIKATKEVHQDLKVLSAELGKTNSKTIKILIDLYRASQKK